MSLSTPAAIFRGYIACDAHAPDLAGVPFDVAFKIATACPGCTTWPGRRSTT